MYGGRGCFSKVHRCGSQRVEGRVHALEIRIIEKKIGMPKA